MKAERKLEDTRVKDKRHDDFTEAMMDLFLELGKVGEIGYGHGYKS